MHPSSSTVPFPRSTLLSAALAALVAIACGGGSPAGSGATDAPVLAWLDPGHVPEAGGTVILHGDRFVDGARVLVGGVAAASVQQLDARQLVAVVPAHVAGVVDVAVENPDGQRSTLAAALRFDAPAPPPPPPAPAAAPELASASPASGLDAGGTEVTLAGAGFDARATVTIGGAPATVTAASATAITISTPPHAPGVVEVIVANPDGQAATLPAAFTYVQVPPPPPPPPASALAIDAVSPASGPTGGGTTAIVSGAGFAPGAVVAFGGVPALVTAASATSLSVVTPAHAAGAADVTVSTPDGQVTTLAGGFTFLAPPPPPPPPGPTAPPPVVAAINRHGSPQAGGDLLLLVGTGLRNAALVTFGGAASTGLAYDPLRDAITVVIPPCPAGSTADVFVDVVVVNADGQSTTVPGFHYGNPPAPSGFTPDLGPKGSTVTISGVDFTADATGARAGLQVAFGGALALVVQKSPTQITVTVPKLNPGVYQLVVTNFDGQYAVAPGAFTVPGP